MSLPKWGQMSLPNLDSQQIIDSLAHSEIARWFSLRWRVDSKWTSTRSEHCRRVQPHGGPGDVSSLLDRLVRVRGSYSRNTRTKVAHWATKESPSGLLRILDFDRATGLKTPYI